MLKNLRHRDRQSSNARLAATDSWISRDDLSVIHACRSVANDPIEAPRGHLANRTWIVSRLRSRARGLGVATTAWFATFSCPTPSAARPDLAACPGWHRHTPHPLPCHSRFRTGTASTASGVARNVGDEPQRKEPTIQDPKARTLQSSHQHPAPATRKTVCQPPGQQQHPQGSKRS